MEDDLVPLHRFSSKIIIIIIPTITTTTTTPSIITTHGFWDKNISLFYSFAQSKRYQILECLLIFELKIHYLI